MSSTHKDYISQSPQHSSSVHGGDHIDGLETQSSDGEITDVIGKGQGHKRPAVLPNRDKLSSSIQVGGLDEITSNVDFLGSKGENTRGKPSKRRKMSNARHPLDVGATTTDDDSS
jgi:hypothetical protein